MITTTLSDLFFNSSEAANVDVEKENAQELAQEFLDMYPSFKEDTNAAELAQDFLNRV